MVASAPVAKAKFILPAESQPVDRRALKSVWQDLNSPAGEAARGAAARLGVDGISKLRIGKAVELELDAADAAEARSQIELLSDRLFANPVIEDWSLELLDS